ncbi:MAG: type I phosphomannose isomerase catalytic subunit [Pseudomonadota bacterium]|nr:type I phosphomannose isomerase catalytic subunit [Pseudomonadota bacterium]
MTALNDPAWAQAPLALVDVPLIPRPWGGDALATLKGQAPGQEPLGESFEAAADPSDEEAAAHPSTVAHPRGDRALLTDLLVSQDVAILGAAVLASEGLRLPLLPKFLDVSGLLSVQAHPPGNPELYVVLEADAEAALYLGFKAQLDPTPWQNRWTDALGTLPALEADLGPEARAALNAWTLGDDRAAAALPPISDTHYALRALNEDTLGLLNRLSLTAGDVIFNAQPDSDGHLGAAIHALGSPQGGRALILEIRRPGVTYRAWDHARLPRRPLGAAEALLSVPLAGSVEKDFRVIPEPGPISCLARSEAFTAWRLTATSDAPVERNTDDRVRTLHIIEGTAQIDGAGGALRLKRGQSALLPAQLGAWTFNGNAVAVEAAPGVVL